MKLANLIISASFLFGCQTALVGGECLEGWVQVDDRCELEGEGGSGECTEEAATECSGDCVDLQSDPDNCGECGVRCESGICDAGVCQGLTAGHVVVMGVTLDDAGPRSAAARLLGNALFLHSLSDLRVAVYTEHADPGSLEHFGQIAADEAQQRGRAVESRSVASAAELAAIASGSEADVIVIPRQYASGSNAAGFRELGASLAGPLDDFIHRQGIIITLALDTNTAALVAGTTLVGSISSRKPTETTLEVVSWHDALSVGMVSPFQATATAAFTVDTSMNDVRTVVTTSDGLPVVLHRAVAPPDQPLPGSDPQD